MPRLKPWLTSGASARTSNGRSRFPSGMTTKGAIVGACACVTTDFLLGMTNKEAMAGASVTTDFLLGMTIKRGNGRNKCKDKQQKNRLPSGMTTKGDGSKMERYRYGGSERD
jgi:hypothetical protein